MKNYNFFRQIIWTTLMFFIYIYVKFSKQLQQVDVNLNY